MFELRLLSPSESSLLLLSKQELPPRRELRHFLEGRVPFSLAGCTLRRGRRSLPGSEGRLPILLIRPPRDRHGSARPGVWIHPLLLFLLFSRSRRAVKVDWKTHRESSPIPLRQPLMVPPREQLIRSDALLRIARGRRFALFRELLLHLRLLPGLFCLESAPSPPVLLLSLAMALCLGFATLLETRVAGGPGPPPRPGEQSGEIAPPGRDELLLQTLSELFRELHRIERNGVALSLLEIEGGPEVLRLRLHTAKPEMAGRQLSETFPSALVESESSSLRLTEAAGSLTLTLFLR